MPVLKTGRGGGSKDLLEDVFDDAAAFVGSDVGAAGISDAK